MNQVESNRLLENYRTRYALTVERLRVQRHEILIQSGRMNPMFLRVDHPDHPLRKAQREIELAILYVPTGELRNDLTDLNVRLTLMLRALDS